MNYITITKTLYITINLIYRYVYSITMKLTQTQIKEAYNEVTLNHREALGSIVRLGGDKEDYQKLYNMLKGWN